MLYRYLCVRYFDITFGSEKLINFRSQEHVFLELALAEAQTYCNFYCLSDCFYNLPFYPLSDRYDQVENTGFHNKISKPG